MHRINTLSLTRLAKFLSLFVCLGASGACATGPTALDIGDAASVGVGRNAVTLRGVLSLPRIQVDGLPLVELSGLAWDEDEDILYAVSDKSVLFHLRPVIEDGRLMDVQVLYAFPLRSPRGDALQGGYADSEGLALLNANNGKRGDTEVLVSFEIVPRITRYTPRGKWLEELKMPPGLASRPAYAELNGALESVTTHPEHGVLTAAEIPLKAEPKDRIALHALSGKRWTLPRLDDNAGTVALETLDDGSVLVLERSFVSVLQPLRLALKRVWLEPGCESDAGTPCRYETVALWHRVDAFKAENFEGLTRYRGNQFFMVSDSNGLPLLGTTLVMFEWAAPPGRAPAGTE